MARAGIGKRKITAVRKKQNRAVMSSVKKDWAGFKRTSKKCGRQMKKAFRSSKKGSVTGGLFSALFRLSWNLVVVSVYLCIAVMVIPLGLIALAGYGVFVLVRWAYHSISGSDTAESEGLEL